MGNPLQAVQCRLPARSHSRLREELEFLIHCAERLEPRTEEEETPFNISSPRRFYTPGNAVLGMQETPFLHAETKEQTVF